MLWAGGPFLGLHLMWHREPAELTIISCCRSEKTRKLRELHEELTTLDTDIQQVAAQAGPSSTKRAPERPSDAELLRRRIAETADSPLGAGALPALPGFPGTPLYPQAFRSSWLKS